MNRSASVRPPSAHAPLRVSLSFCLLASFPLGAGLLMPRASFAASITPATRCEVGKLKTVSTYASCRLKADMLALQKNLSVDFTKCVEKFDAKFPKLEAQAGPGVCPSENDLGDIRGRTDDFENSIAVLLSGGSIPVPQCGDGVIDIGEDCDVGTLDGQSCATQGFFNGTLRCGPGCAFDTTGCHATRFEDTGATLIDWQNSLQWEKKGSQNGLANAADAHDADNTYTWTVGSGNSTMTGTLFTDFLPKLNGTTNVDSVVTENCYDGHCDWRVPTIDELKTLYPPDPAIDPNVAARYWSSSTRSGLPQGAYFLDFSSGAASPNTKTLSYYARAVRAID